MNKITNPFSVKNVKDKKSLMQEVAGSVKNSFLLEKLAITIFNINSYVMNKTGKLIKILLLYKIKQVF